MMGTGHSRASQIYKGMRFNYLLISEWNFIGAFQKGHIGPSWRLKVFILTVGKLHCSAASQSQTTARNKFDSLRWSFILTHLVRIINLNLPICSCDMQNYFPPTNLRCCNRSCQWCQSLPNTVFPPRETFDFFRSDFNYWIYLDSKKKHRSTYGWIDICDFGQNSNFAEFLHMIVECYHRFKRPNTIIGSNVI